ncbi:hypothetical protein N7539_003321 [Penicillium diatomitis]|uniref:Uncharacterized protein n=1 Tax=Penicillium diatomitis TaxID=2819901 RepID=A0A9W9XGE6_9EURO|nr:uncharacterized protein N7539_003321 [Penicillium diatomitis]KAJ5491754.1 hypothetical protein N7539_003321 [Penicillium diatomitis]
MPSSSSASSRSGSLQSSAGSNNVIQSKADPNAALYEAQPMAVSADMGNRDVFSLRSMQHKDREGKVIADPDLSNPTRPRFERPLDTIRGFEAAIESTRKQNRM